MEDDSDLYDILSETIVAARKNILKAFIQVLLGMAVVCLTIIIDHPSIGILNNVNIESDFANEFWVIKYLFIFGFAFYSIVAFTYVMRSLSHIHEARYLLKRLES
ncbi:hypothetical protein [Halomonas sp. BM-2019]|uniref:hypothetical protein n=1 Tax=Halomonas sp. BM-2019 TaxID=2811227 RepID=UPI001B3C3200|nr:MAG: hypothetical protein J5F18_06785 [Halomonas sp. BM-2019]